MEILKIRAWNGAGNSQLPRVSSELGMQLLSIEWDFSQFKEDKPGGQSRSISLMELATALQKTMAAADAIGTIEHTSDWDPLLVIELKNGQTIESESHMYQIDYVDREIMEIEAPSLADYKDIYETEAPKEYYTELGKSGAPALVFKLEDIKLITVNPQ